MGHTYLYGGMSMKRNALLLLLVAFGFYSACYVTILNTPASVFKGEIPVKVSKDSVTEVDRDIHEHQLPVERG